MRRTDFAYHEQPDANGYYRPAQRDPRNDVKAAKNGLWAVMVIGFAFSLPLWMALIQDYWPHILRSIERLAR